MQKRLLQEGKLYYGRSKLNVEERFHLQQCYKCQGFNHVSKDCTSEVSVCKRCGGDHDVKQCEATSTKLCVNCNNSSEHKSGSHSHYSGYRLCPVRVSAINRMAKN